MHFYKFHIGDYMSHTRHLSHYEDLAYRRLLDFYFLHEQPIRHRDAARHIGMRDHEEDVLTVLNEFFLSTENGFVNVRADKEIAEFRKHQAVSAYGAFIRDNPSLKHLANKEDYITHYLASSIDVYIGTLRGNDVPIMGTSSTDDAPLTINHNHNQVNTYICPPSGEPEQSAGLKIPDCQHQGVIELYHQFLPTLRKVEVWNSTRQGYLRQRWREVAEELAQEKPIETAHVLNWWAEFFQHIGKSKFLTGKVNSKDGRAFTADLEWILKPSNFAKIVEGKYHGTH